ncbi:hypothetical protein [Actinomadura chokoriensis]|uniref:Uncharacterized protein n=1 Tax=Actinomadura chokoriensis TaxID=454156 RepID=A0ABV4R6G1_9ACTN
MGEDGLLILALAALAAYTGIHWGRARRSVTDLRLGRRRAVTLRQGVAREPGHVMLVIIGSALALFLAVRYG